MKTLLIAIAAVVLVLVLFRFHYMSKHDVGIIICGIVGGIGGCLMRRTQFRDSAIIIGAITGIFLWLKILIRFL